MTLCRVVLPLVLPRTHRSGPVRSTREYSFDVSLAYVCLNDLVYRYIGGTSGKIYLIVNDIGTNTGEGLDFIDGQVFLERFYTVFDSTNSRFGIATTSSTAATSN